MQKLVSKIGLTRHIVKEFEIEVNSLLETGWHLVTISIEQRHLRIVCMAVLHLDTYQEPNIAETAPMQPHPLAMHSAASL